MKRRSVLEIVKNLHPEELALLSHSKGLVARNQSLTGAEKRYKLV
jgi:hypothetical protein